MEILTVLRSISFEAVASVSAWNLERVRVSGATKYALICDGRF